MGEILFIGLGLFDEKDITVKGMEEARSCDILFAEFYTSKLVGASQESVESLLGKDIHVLGREEVEKGDVILEAARSKRVGFLIGGDPMTATTHVDLRLRAEEGGIPTRIVYGVSILTAAASLVGLQSYKFGRTTSLPFPQEKFFPTSPYEVIHENRMMGLHTLILLDIDEGGKEMDAKEALGYLLEMEGKERKMAFTEDTIVCVISEAGSPEAVARCERVGELMDLDLGKPLHCLIIPADLHFMEKKALMAFAGAPDDIDEITH
ncbi:MAG: diphthine synthase [Thermoplasmata archaeon]